MFFRGTMTKTISDEATLQRGVVSVKTSAIGCEKPHDELDEDGFVQADKIVMEGLWIIEATSDENRAARHRF